MKYILFPTLLLLAFFVVPASTSALPAAIDETIAISAVQPGMVVQLEGVVTRILDEDEFRLADDTGDIRIYTGWQNRLDVRVGERLIVRGTVDDDLIDRLRQEVYATEIVREDGKVIQLTTDN